MTRRASYKTRAAKAGVGLIEVLIAVLVMAIGLLGIAALQATALRNSQSALERSHAVIQSYAILDAMRANRVNAEKGAYDIALSEDCEVADDGTLAKDDLNYWYTSLEAALGDAACGAIARAGGIVTISIRWDDSRGSGGETDQTIVTRTQL